MPKTTYRALTLTEWVQARDLLCDSTFRKEYMVGRTRTSIASRITSQLNIPLTPTRLDKAVREFNIPLWAKPNPGAPATQAQARKLFGLIRQIELCLGEKLDWDAPHD